MSITKISSLKGHIDCPYCFSLLEWDAIEDVKISNGSKFITCPECGEKLILDQNKDYWTDPLNTEGNNAINNNGNSSSPLIVNVRIKQDQQQGRGREANASIYILDKTYAEIENAFLSGRQVLVFSDFYRESFEHEDELQTHTFNEYTAIMSICETVITYEQRENFNESIFYVKLLYPQQTFYCLQKNEFPSTEYPDIGVGNK